MTEDVRHINAATPEPAVEAEEPAPEEPPYDEAEDDFAEPTERHRRVLSPVVRRIVAVVLIVLLLISGGVATWLYFEQYRPDQQTGPDVARAVAHAASDGTTALLSYSSDSLDQDFANAKTHLGGDFLSYYDQFSQQTLAPAAREKSMKTTARVTGAAVSELHPDWATVLVFVDQVTTAKDAAQPALSVTSVVVRMAHLNGSWLITKFTPV